MFHDGYLMLLAAVFQPDLYQDYEAEAEAEQERIEAAAAVRGERLGMRFPWWYRPAESP